MLFCSFWGHLSPIKENTKKEKKKESERNYNYLDIQHLMEKLLGGLSLSHKPILFLFELKTSLKTPKLLTKIKMYRKFYDQINEKKNELKIKGYFL